MKFVFLLAFVVKALAKCCDSRNGEDKFLLTTSDDLKVQVPPLNLEPLVSEEEAFLAFSKEQGFILRKDFGEIVNFISRVKKAKFNDLFTKKDEAMLRKMDFAPLLNIAFPCLVFNPAECAKHKHTWLKILNAYKLKIPFFQALYLLFYLYPVDSFTREEFLEFYCAIDFLQGGKDQFFERIEFLSDTLEESFSIKNCELRYLCRRAFFTPESFTLDFDQVFSALGDRSFQIAQEIFQSYSNKAKSCELKKIDISHLPDSERRESLELIFHFYELLRSHSATLESLSIDCANSAPRLEIWFTALTELSIMQSFESYESCAPFRFLLHSNYTVVDSSEEFTLIYGPENREYFRVCHVTNEIQPLLHIVELNPNLTELSLKFWLQGPSEELQQAVKRLKNLKYFRAAVIPCDVHNYFDSGSKLESLGLWNSDEFIDWNLLDGNLAHLKILVFLGFDLVHFNEFLHFLSKSNLKSLFLPFLIVEDFDLFFSTLNGLKTLLSVELSMYEYCVVSGPCISEIFVALKIKEVGIDQNVFLKENSIFSHLPSGKGVKYLKIDNLNLEFFLISPRDIQVLKSKFPLLELLIVPKGTGIEFLPEVDFEIREEIKSSDEEFFSSVPHVFFE